MGILGIRIFFFYKKLISLTFCSNIYPWVLSGLLILAGGPWRKETIMTNVLLAPQNPGAPPSLWNNQLKCVLTPDFFPHKIEKTSQHFESKKT